MIDAYNRSQVLRGIVAFALSVLTLALTGAFFYWVSWQVLSRLVGMDEVSLGAWVGTVSLTGCVCVAGYLRGRRGAGHYDYDESGINLQLEYTSGGNFMMQRYAHRVATPTYLLGQVFLAAPLQFLKAKQCLVQRIKPYHGLEPRLLLLLKEIRDKGKWVPLEHFNDCLKDLRLLIQMDHVEFSPLKGVVRARS